MAAIFIIGWILLGLIGSGFMFAYFQDKYPDLAEDDFADDLISSLVLAITGPVNLIISIIWISTHGYYGWRLWSKK